MEQILQFIGQNKYVLTIGFIAFIIQFEGLVYLMSHKQSDFSYSGHEFEWFDGDAKKTILAILAFIFGIATFGICIFKFNNRKDLIWNL